jgi:predicted AAA+ superfamily ATPase
MDLSTLEMVAFEQKELFAKEDTSVPRSVNYDEYINTEQIVVISDVRRCGKSTLLRQFASHFANYRYLNFDDKRLIHRRGNKFFSSKCKNINSHLFFSKKIIVSLQKKS